MSVVNRNGFEQTPQNVWITKDPQASLTYTLDWSEWLDTGDTISAVTWSVAARVNDPTPLTTVTSGVTGANKQTYIRLSGGQENKTYVVTARVTTANGFIDRRNFRVQVENRSA